MTKYQAIRWHGMTQQGVLKATSTIAQVLAADGKYIQTLPEFYMNRTGIPPSTFVRVASSPIRLHSMAAAADIEILMEAPLLKYIDVIIKTTAKKNTLFIINSSLAARTLKEKFNLDNKIITVPVVTILPPPLTARAYFLFGALAVTTLGLMTPDHFKTGVKELLLLNKELDKETAAEIVKGIDHVLNEAQTA